MKVRVIKTAYLDNAIRNAGDVFDWSYSGDKIPDCVEVIGNPTQNQAASAAEAQAVSAESGQTKTRSGSRK